MKKTQDQLDRTLDNTSARPTSPPVDVAQPHPKQQEAMQLFQKVMRNRNMGVSANIADIAQQLNVVSRNPTFPEALFVQHFLPLFADEVKPTNEVNVRTWIDKIAGGETIAVDIIDEEGKVLFTVPPMFDHSVLEQVRPGGMSMTRVERHYSRLKEVDATASQTFLSKTLQGMHIKDKPTEELYANMRTWNQIFERYGKQDKIINLLNLENDPNKDTAVNIARPSVSTTTDVGDYELDTD